MKRALLVLLFLVASNSAYAREPTNWNIALSICAASGIELQAQESSTITDSATASKFLGVTYSLYQWTGVKDAKKLSDPANGKYCLVNQKLENVVSRCPLASSDVYPGDEGLRRLFTSNNDTNELLYLYVNQTHCSFIYNGTGTIHLSVESSRVDLSRELPAVLVSAIGSLIYFPSLLLSNPLIWFFALTTGILFALSRLTSSPEARKTYERAFKIFLWILFALAVLILILTLILGALSPFVRY
jgi:hypothetical protein